MSILSKGESCHKYQEQTRGGRWKLVRGIALEKRRLVMAKVGKQTLCRFREMQKRYVTYPNIKNLSVTIWENGNRILSVGRGGGQDIEIRRSISLLIYGRRVRGNRGDRSVNRGNIFDTRKPVQSDEKEKQKIL